MILKGIENETIWRVAHKWDNQDPDNSNPETLTPFVKDRLMRLAQAANRQKIGLYKSNNLPVLDGNFIINMIMDWKIFWQIRNTYWHQKFDKDVLDSLYVSRGQILRWCKNEFLAEPKFWIENNSLQESIKDSPASKREKGIIAWRSYAELLWLIDPRIHPKHIAESDALRTLDNVKDYSPETVRDWIVDLDPKKNERKTGAPKKIEYYINLKTGVVNEKAFPSFFKK